MSMARQVLSGSLLVVLSLVQPLLLSALELQLPVGPVEGLQVVDGVYQFIGIPFALPPVGERRFMPPEPHTGWTETSVQSTNACIQTSKFFFAQMEQTTSEDCLYLNVYVPDDFQDPTKGPRPVLFYIHGGAFILGSSLTELVTPNFTQFVRESGAIVVTTNYRLGAFGFLAHPGADAVSGNAGILDQKLALQFVREHIALFGGDADRITLFGNSAGAFSICLHLELSRGLFKRAILSSPSCEFSFPSRSEGHVMAES